MTRPESPFPSPCGKYRKCTNCYHSGSKYTECSDWLTWFRWWWKQFNLYAKKYGIEPTTKEGTEDAVV